MYRQTLHCTTVTSYTNMPSIWPGLTNTNIRGDSTHIDIRYPFLLNHLLKACFAQFSVIEKCGVRVNIWDNSFTDDLSGGMNLSWDVKYSGFSGLQRHCSPSGLCGARLPRTPGHSGAARESAPSWEVQQTPPCRTHCRHQPLGSRADNNQSVTQCGGVQSLHSNYVIDLGLIKIECSPPCCPGGVVSGGRCL